MSSPLNIATQGSADPNSDVPSMPLPKQAQLISNQPTQPMLSPTKPVAAKADGQIQNMRYMQSGISQNQYKWNNSDASTNNAIHSSYTNSAPHFYANNSYQTTTNNNYCQPNSNGEWNGYASGAYSIEFS